MVFLVYSSGVDIVTLRRPLCIVFVLFGDELTLQKKKLVYSPNCRLYSSMYKYLVVESSRSVITTVYLWTLPHQSRGVHLLRTFIAGVGTPELTA